jgi:cell fate (sporulation/competence/biofilm development) regulator YlbF (YheA/YmcA/DUF963 family)
MNLYDHAHNLACALKESGEYKGLLEAKKKLEADPKNKEMLLEFRRCQWEMEKAKAFQKDVDEITKRRIEQLGELVNANPTVQEYLMAEFRFGQIMSDIQKILSEAISEWFKSAAELVVDDEK